MGCYRRKLTFNSLRFFNLAKSPTNSDSGKKSIKWYLGGIRAGNRNSSSSRWQTPNFRECTDGLSVLDRPVRKPGIEELPCTVKKSCSSRTMDRKSVCDHASLNRLGLPVMSNERICSTRNNWQNTAMGSRVSVWGTLNTTEQLGRCRPRSSVGHATVVLSMTVSYNIISRLGLFAVTCNV